MTETEVRLRCLELAAGRIDEPRGELLSLAAEMAAFVLGSGEKSRPQNFAELKAALGGGGG